MQIGTRRGARGRDAAGYTLIELLIALALSSIVMAGAGTMLLQAYTNEAAYREQNDAQRNARAALDSITDDLREARKGSSNVGVEPTARVDLNINATTSFRFITLVYDPVQKKDVVQRITLAQTLYINVGEMNQQKRVRYWLEGPNLMREVYTDVDMVTRRRMVIARNLGGSTPLTIMRGGSVPSRAIVVVTAVSGNNPSSTVALQSDVIMRNFLL